MYQRFFGLRESPFNVTLDVRYVFLTGQIQEVLAGLTDGIQDRMGFTLLTGQAGTGKTTLLNRLRDWLREQRVATAFISNSQLSTGELIDCILSDFEIACDSSEKSQALLRLNHWLLELYRAGERAVLIVDDAQNLSLEVLEQIRLLANLEISTEKQLQVVLAGQLELEEKLKHPQLRQLRQGIALRCRTSSLSLEETFGYVAERLRIAGANGEPIFSKEAIQTIYRYSRGIPREVNMLCEHALINGYVDHLRPVPAHLVEEVAREFQLDELSPVPSAGIAPRAQPLDEAESLLQNLEEFLGQWRQSNRALSLSGGWKI